MTECWKLTLYPFKRGRIINLFIALPKPANNTLIYPTNSKNHELFLWHRQKYTNGYIPAN